MNEKDKDKKPAATPKRSMRALAISLVATGVLLGADLGSKQWVLDALSEERLGPEVPVCEPDEYGNTTMQRAIGEPVVLVDGYLELRYAENCGAAFGLLRSAPEWVRHAVFGLAAVVASVVLFMMFALGRGQVFFAWSVPMIVSGALGNLIDRFRYGYVIDFVRFHLEDGWAWPTFNIADCGIVVGVALLMIDGFFEGRREPSGEAAKAAKSVSK